MSSEESNRPVHSEEGASGPVNPETQGDAAPPQKRAVIAVIESEGQWLVIRRAESVRAPGKLCFPGGTIEAGESQPVALVRELREELQIEVSPSRLLWISHSSWGTELNWWTAKIVPTQIPSPNPAEVAWWGWMWPEEMERHPDTLSTNLEFLNAWKEGRFFTQDR